MRPDVNEARKLLGQNLRRSLPLPPEDGKFDDLVRQIDLADRRDRK